MVIKRIAIWNHQLLQTSSKAWEAHRESFQVCGIYDAEIGGWLVITEPSNPMESQPERLLEQNHKTIWQGLPLPTQTMQKQNTEGLCPELKNPEKNLMECGSTTVGAVAVSLNINDDLAKSSLSLTPCPEPGKGVHYWYMTGAWDCRLAGLTPEQAIKTLEQASSREPKYREIEDAVAKVYDCESIDAVRRSKPITAVYDPEAAQRIAQQLPVFDASSLSERSPIDPQTCTPADVLAHLYEPGEKVLIFNDNFSRGDHLWEKPQADNPHDPHELDHFRTPEQDTGVLFLCNPVHGEYREVQRLASDRNPAGRSRRCEECITSFRYIVVESDEVESTIWIRILVQLPLPISAVYTSGGRSIHALVRVNAACGEDWRDTKDKIANALVTLGADPAAMTAVRLTRLPGCYRREKGAQQELLYLNPNPAGTPIAVQPVRSTASVSQPEGRTA